MTKKLVFLSLAAALGLSTATLAQDAEAPATDAADAPASEAAAAPEAPASGETEAPSAPDDLNLGATVDEEGRIELEVGQPFVREEFDDWALRCVKAPEGQDDPCQLYQLLADEAGNSVAEISMFPLSDGGQAKAGATIVVPLETLLTEPLKIAVDDGQARIFPYSFCNRAGCVARVGFTQADLNSFKAGAKATMTLVPAVAPDQSVDLTISLNGFTAGITATQAQ